MRPLKPGEKAIAHAYRERCRASHPSLPNVLGVCYELADQGFWGMDERGFEGDPEAWYDVARDKCDYDYVERVLKEQGLAVESGSGSWRSKPVVAEVPQGADLDVINRHRRSLGMDPIDPVAGWTVQELADMAESIRKTGRMSNPRLKRRLMR